MLLSRRLHHPFWTNILDPFALAPLKKTVEFWTATERNAQLIPTDGVLLINRIFWIGIGIIALIIVNKYFTFNVVRDKKTSKIPNRIIADQTIPLSEVKMPIFCPKFSQRANLN